MRSLQECLERIDELKEERTFEDHIQEGEHYLSAIREFYNDLKAYNVSMMEALQRIVDIDRKHGGVGFCVELDTEIESYLVKALRIIADQFEGDIRSQGGGFVPKD